MSDFLKYCRLRSTVWRALKVGAVITPILTVINHFREITALELGLAFWLQVAMTFVVPYCVSTYSSAMASIEEHSRTTENPQVPEGGGPP